MSTQPRIPRPCASANTVSTICAIAHPGWWGEGQLNLLVRSRMVVLTWGDMAMLSASSSLGKLRCHPPNRLARFDFALALTTAVLRGRPPRRPDFVIRRRARIASWWRCYRESSIEAGRVSPHRAVGADLTQPDGLETNPSRPRRDDQPLQAAQSWLIKCTGGLQSTGPAPMLTPHQLLRRPFRIKRRSRNERHERIER
jgi:hypothetical protein